MRRFAPIVALALLGQSCAGTPEPEPEPLPFHVALIPLSSSTVRESPQIAEHPDATEMDLRPDPLDVSHALADALRSTCFTDVTVLEPPPTPGGVPRPTDDDWIRLAREARADLVYEFSLRHEETIREDKNGLFWLNVPLFLVGGPGCYFLDDHTYRVEAELTGSLYDLYAIDGDEIRLGDPSARVALTNVRFEEVDLDFIDRADGTGEFGVSLICPSGFLAEDDEGVEAVVNEAVVADLARQVVASLQSRRADILRPEYLVPFVVDPDSVAIELLGDDSFRLEAPVELRSDAAVLRMHSYRLEVGDEVREGVFPDVPTGEPYRVVEAFAAPPEVELVRLELCAGARDRFVRAYTFRLPHPVEEEPVP